MIKVKKVKQVQVEVHKYPYLIQHQAQQVMVICGGKAILLICMFIMLMDLQINGYQ